MISNRSLQNYLKAKALYSGSINGVLGRLSFGAMRKLLNGIMGNWSESRVRMGAMQFMLKDAGFDPGPIDGLFGAMTDGALDAWERHKAGLTPDPDWRDYQSPHKADLWPTERECPVFYGQAGKRKEAESNLILVGDLPYELVYDSQRVTRVRLHKKCAPSWLRIQHRIVKEYGIDEIRRLNIHITGGTYNPRPKRGGSSWSMHAYGCAEDRWPAGNRLRWGRDKAAFAKPEYDAMHAAYEAEGWINLGREKGYDFMHWQAARL